jgi:HEAT repeat protein
VEPLINALKSTDWEARREVVSALGNTGSENAVDPLIDVLLHDENEQVRETAASWLGRIGAERSVPSFVKILKNYLAGTEHSTSLVFTSVTALGEIGSTQGLTVLKKLTESLEQSGATENLSKVEHAIKEIGSASDLTNRKCIVCNLPLGKTGELVQCPFCKNIAHKDHMLGWLKGREYCPTCGRPIKDSQLVQVKPGLRASTLRTEPEAKKH